MQTNLFDHHSNDGPNNEAPLAERMRPSTLDEFVGQDHILKEGRVLRRAIETGEVQSLIFWGPPDTGKTTLARIIAKKTASSKTKYFGSLPKGSQSESLTLGIVKGLSCGVADLVFVPEIR